MRPRGERPGQPAGLGPPGPLHRVDVWTVAPTTTVPGRALAVLDAAERQRARSMPAPASVRFVLGRALLRGVVAARLGVSPDRVVLRAVCPRCGGPHGRVVVAPSRDGRVDPAGLHVSVSRSGPLVAVALSTAGTVGVDVESCARVAAAPLADVVLAPGEAVGRGGLPGDVVRAVVGTQAPVGAVALARTWVRKEAVLKALGTGLATDPSSVRLTRAPRTLRGVDAVAATVPVEPAVPGVPGEPARPGVPGGPVVVADLRVGRGRVGAVALARPDLLASGGGAPAAGLVVRCYDGAPVLDALPG